ncbi:MAG: hypothetical protein KTR21_09065 [Rhodobacteraceae bacterium]|nr:hypothetical protein [Paracoccaceae bacterium]
MSAASLLADAGPTSPTANPARTLGAMLLAGVIGLIAWELWIRYGAPVTTGKFPLNGPVGLAQQSLNALFGINQFTAEAPLLGLLTARQIAETAHYLTAFVGYPLGYLWIASPIARTVTPGVPADLRWPLAGLAYGFGLFVFAGYGMWTLLLGNTPFFGWSGLAYGSMIGHMLLGLGIAAGARLRGCG